MQRFLKGKGSLFGFFVFIPVIGDIMIVALGLLRANPLGTLLSMMVGKFSRYYLVVIGINYLKEWFPNPKPTIYRLSIIYRQPYE